MQPTKIRENLSCIYIGMNVQHLTKINQILNIIFAHMNTKKIIFACLIIFFAEHAHKSIIFLQLFLFENPLNKIRYGDSIGIFL